MSNLNDGLICAGAVCPAVYFVVPDFDCDMRYTDVNEARAVAESLAREEGCGAVHVVALVDSCAASIQWESCKSNEVINHE